MRTETRRIASSRGIPSRSSETARPSSLREGSLAFSTVATSAPRIV